MCILETWLGVVILFLYFLKKLEEMLGNRTNDYFMYVNA